ncbi:eukaryotic aspartyl protease family protein [Striga asiatica]|uniref:Eukaryotic aspartyl protease family protein n=1 Tax=Striga asiatica TaxID=4170 RepID=A0A5A7RL26_STRAF|nr:eukaryotic aspartyl protease family protein [Striga asiatica]
MKSLPISLHCVALAFLVMFMTKFQTTQATGFTIDLIHRDSLHSPSLYYSSERIKNAILRSFDHANNLLARPNLPSADIISDRGEYLMKFTLGTPGVETLAIADTGNNSCNSLPSPAVTDSRTSGEEGFQHGRLDIFGSVPIVGRRGIFFRNRGRGR